MHRIDLFIFGVYLLLMLAVGFFFLKKNQNTEDYFVGRKWKRIRGTGFRLPSYSLL